MAKELTIFNLIDKKLKDYIGKNFDTVAEEIEKIIDRSPYCMRWLEPWTGTYGEFRPDRINVHVDMIHIITHFRVG